MTYIKTIIYHYSLSYIILKKAMTLEEYEIGRWSRLRKRAFYLLNKSTFKLTEGVDCKALDKINIDLSSLMMHTFYADYQEHLRSRASTYKILERFGLLSRSSFALMSIIRASLGKLYSLIGHIRTFATSELKLERPLDKSAILSNMFPQHAFNSKTEVLEVDTVIGSYAEYLKSPYLTAHTDRSVISFEEYVRYSRTRERNYSASCNQNVNEVSRIYLYDSKLKAYDSVGKFICFFYEVFIASFRLFRSAKVNFFFGYVTCRCIL
jgi:hypothetical protein